MVRSRSVELAQLWRERLERQAQAKCSVAEFCRREGVSQPAFYHWRKRLQSGPRWRTRRPSSPGEDLRFVSVAMPAALLAAGVQIDLPSGAIVRLSHQAPAEIVAAAVRAASERATPAETPAC
jgi:hypothetical protein